MLPLPSRSTLFPYTTLFRSGAGDLPRFVDFTKRYLDAADMDVVWLLNAFAASEIPYTSASLSAYVDGSRPNGISDRSEEHTSELQSHHDIVCRLLLEKKNKPCKFACGRQYCSPLLWGAPWWSGGMSSTSFSPRSSATWLGRRILRDVPRNDSSDRCPR